MGLFEMIGGAAKIALRDNNKPSGLYLSYAHTYEITDKLTGKRYTTSADDAGTAMHCFSISNSLDSKHCEIKQIR